MSKLPKLRHQNFFHMQQPSWCHRIHSTQQWSVTNIALQGEGITWVLANYVPVRRATFGFSHAGSLPQLRENVCEMAGIKKEPLMNLSFSTRFWLWSWVTLSTLKNIHNHFDTEGAEREKLSYMQPNICYFWAVGCELFLRCWKLIWELFSAGCRPCVGVCSGRWEQKPIWLSSHSAGDSCTTTRQPHIHKELIIIIVSHWAVAFAGTYSVLLDQ